MSASLILLMAACVYLAIGVPVAFALGLSTITAFIVEGDLTEEHPMRYHKMKVIYQFKGKDLPMDKLEKAVKLSEEKYCGVSAAYRLAMDLSIEIRVIE